MKKNLIRKVIARLDAKKLREKAEEVIEENHFINCRLFTQLLTKTNNIEAQPQLDAIEPGAILWWGDEKNNQYRHCAVALDKDTVLQVDEWGPSEKENLKEESLKEVEKYWGKVKRIYKPKGIKS